MTNRRHAVRGYTMTDDGFVSTFGSREMLVEVDADGRAWPSSPEDSGYDAREHGPLSPLVAERWSDGDRLGLQFSPDEGEFERCGIKFDDRRTAS